VGSCSGKRCKNWAGDVSIGQLLGDRSSAPVSGEAGSRD
jgi:hypothetical protein